MAVVCKMSGDLSASLELFHEYFLTNLEQVETSTFPNKNAEDFNKMKLGVKRGRNTKKSKSTRLNVVNT